VASRTGTGAWTCTTYDARGRTTQVVHPGGRTVTTDYAADPDGTGPAGPDPLTTTVTDPAGTITTRTDLLGRTVAYTDALGTLTTTSYDPVLGLPERTSSTPAGSTARVQAWTYDPAGRVETVAVAGTLVADPTWTPAGELASVAYPGNTASMTVTGRDPAGRVTAQQWSTPAGTHTDTRTVSRAARTLAGTWSGPAAAASAKTFGYDTAGRLTAATVSRATTGAGTVTHTYSYSFGPADASCTGVAGSVPTAGLNGNRTKTTDTVAGATPGHRLVRFVRPRLHPGAGLTAPGSVWWPRSRSAPSPRACSPPPRSDVPPRVPGPSATATGYGFGPAEASCGGVPGGRAAIGPGGGCAAARAGATPDSDSACTAALHLGVLWRALEGVNYS
jgi:hypothetical protein